MTCIPNIRFRTTTKVLKYHEVTFIYMKAGVTKCMKTGGETSTETFQVNEAIV